MPQTFAVKHTQFLEQYFASGKSQIIGKERQLFAVNKDGYCFSMKIMVKQIPNLEGGIQYAGMIREIPEQCDYIITTEKGIIDTFTRKIGQFISQIPSAFKENEIHIKNYAPELSDIYASSPRKKATQQNSKFSVPGGHISFLCPHYNFVSGILQSSSGAIIKESEERLETQKIGYQEISMSANTNKNAPPKTNSAGVDQQNAVLLSSSVREKHSSESPSHQSGANVTIRRSFAKETRNSEDEMRRPVRFEVQDFSYVLSNGSNRKPYTIKVIKITELGNVGDRNGSPFSEEHNIRKSDSDSDVGPIDSKEHLEALGTNIKRDVLMHLIDIQPTDIHVLSPIPSSHNYASGFNKKGSTSGGRTSGLLRRVRTLKNFNDAADNTLVNIKRQESDSSLRRSESDVNLFKAHGKPVENAKQPENKAEASPGTEHPVVIKTEKCVNPNENQHIEEDKLSPKDANKQKLDPSYKSLLSHTSSNTRGGTKKKRNKILCADDESPEEYLPSQSETRLKTYFMRLEAHRNKFANKQKQQAENQDGAEIIKNSNKDEQNVNNFPDLDSEDKSLLNGTCESASSQDNRTRGVYNSLRSAIDEKYVPRSLRNFGYTINFASLFILVIASIFFNNLDNNLIVAFFVAIIVYFTKMKRSLAHVEGTELRMTSMLLMDYTLANMMIISKDYRLKTQGNVISENYYLTRKSLTELSSEFTSLQNKLMEYSENLKEAQAGLTLEVEDWRNGFEFLEEIELVYLPIKGMLKSKKYTLFQAIMEIVAASQRISGMSIDIISYNDPSIYFVFENSLNAVLAKLEQSNDKILGQTNDIIHSNNILVIIMISVVSGILVIAKCVIIPLIYYIKKTKQDLLLLFVRIPQKQVSCELNKCRKFALAFFQSKDIDYNQDDYIDDTTQGYIALKSLHTMKEKEKRNSMKNEEKINKSEHIDKAEHKEHYKKLHLGLGLLITKILILCLIIEGYFLLKFFLAKNFLSGFKKLEDAYNSLLYLYPTQTLFLLVQKYFLLNF